jgi:hypothetical protein
MSRESERIVEQWGEQKELKKFEEKLMKSEKGMFAKLMGLEPKKKPPAKKPKKK